MKTLLAALALTAALTPAALAAGSATPPDTAPIKLTEAQMDQVTAGGSLPGGAVEYHLDDAVTAGGGDNNGDSDFRYPTVSAAQSGGFGGGNDV